MPQVQAPKGVAVGRRLESPAAASGGCGPSTSAAIDSLLAQLNQHLKDHPAESAIGQVVTNVSGSQSIDDLVRDQLMYALDAIPNRCWSSAQRALYLQLARNQAQFSAQEQRNIEVNWYASLIAFLGKLTEGETYIRAGELIGGAALIYVGLKMFGVPLPKPGIA